jgi:hypothetical protein
MTGPFLIIENPGGCSAFVAVEKAALLFSTGVGTNICGLKQRSGKAWRPPAVSASILL